MRYVNIRVLFNLGCQYLKNVLMHNVLIVTTELHSRITQPDILYGYFTLPRVLFFFYKTSEAMTSNTLSVHNK